MQNLGKIFLLLGLAGASLFASVSTGVDRTFVTQGEAVNFSITTDSNKDKISQINTLCGYPVTGRESQTNLSIINGNVTKKKTLIYSFVPQKSCTIEPVTITSEGKEIHTKTIKITVSAPLPNSDAKFSIRYESKKKVLYKNEPFVVTLKTKLRQDIGVVDSNFSPSPMQDFWVRKQQMIKTYPEGKYFDGGTVYLLVPKHSGELKIAPAQVNLAVNAQPQQSAVWGGLLPQVKWKRYYSNALHVKVKPLPQGISIVGNHLKIAFKVDKTKIPANGAVNAILKVSGEGNLGDIDGFHPSISGVSVFANDANTSYTLHPDGYSATYVKKITFVADSNFTIPSMGFRYLDTQTGKVVQLATQPVAITVTGVKTPQKVQVVKASNAVSTVAAAPCKEERAVWLVSAFLGGVLIGIMVMLGKPRRWLPQRRSKEIKISLKDTKAILTKLMQHKEDPEVREMIDLLDQKLYGGQDVKIDMQKLKALQKRYGF